MFVPTSCVISQLAAFKELQVSRLKEPAPMLVGLAVMLTVGRLFTVTVTLCCTVPYALLAVIV